MMLQRGLYITNTVITYCQGAYETFAHFVGECDRWQEIWGKPYLHANDFQHV